MVELLEILRVGNENIELQEPVRAFFQWLVPAVATVASTLIGASSARSAARQRQQEGRRVEAARREEAERQRKLDKANRMYGWASSFGTPTRASVARPVTGLPSMWSETLSGALGGARGGYEFLQQQRERKRRSQMDDMWTKLLQRTVDGNPGYLGSTYPYTLPSNRYRLPYGVSLLDDTMRFGR